MLMTHSHQFHQNIVENFKNFNDFGKYSKKKNKKNIPALT